MKDTIISIVLTLIVCAIIVFVVHYMVKQEKFNAIKITSQVTAPKLTVHVKVVDDRAEKGKEIQRKLSKLQPKLDSITCNTIARSIQRSCSIYDIEPELVMALIFKESSVNPQAESVAGCVGLMQVNYNVWKDELKLRSYHNTFEIAVNIDTGCRILRRYRDKYDNWNDALNDYSGGKVGYADQVMRLANELVVME